MPLRGEVDDEAGVHHEAGWHDEHAARLHLAPLHRPGIGEEVLRIGLLELESDTLAQVPDGVHRVHEGLGVSLEEVRLCLLDHREPRPFVWSRAFCAFQRSAG